MMFYGGPVVHFEVRTVGSIDALCGDSAAESTSLNVDDVDCQECLSVLNDGTR